jgi:ABC-type phosphonate transport system ATPase subunit
MRTTSSLADIPLTQQIVALTIVLNNLWGYRQLLTCLAARQSWRQGQVCFVQKQSSSVAAQAVEGCHCLRLAEARSCVVQQSPSLR